MSMTIELPFKTFGDLEKQGLQMRVACQRSRRQVVIEVTPALRDQAVAGRRFRCKERCFDGTDCREVGLATIEHQRSWVRRQADAARQAARASRQLAAATRNRAR